jgi:hypothetical protein
MRECTDSSVGLPSPIQQSLDFFEQRASLDFEGSNINMHKVKKIEFSQSFKKDRTEESLPFTHENLDRAVLGTLNDKEFSINEAKKLLKKVV